MSVKSVFVLELHFSDDSSQRCELPIAWQLPEPEDIYERLYERLTARDLEGRYGVHDFSTNDTGNQNLYEAIGYTSYEVEKDKVDDLLKEWEQILLLLNIHILGDWTITHYVEY